MQGEYSKDRVMQAATAGCCLAIAVLSSVPGAHRPHVPGFSDKLEHVAAFLVLGSLTILAVPRTTSRWVVCVGLMSYAAVLELAQILVPGRVASFADLAASSLGAFLGLSLGLLMRQLYVSANRRLPPSRTSFDRLS
jgi:VanZ family protein